MIELLILYILNNQGRTLYSLRAEITEKFGFFTKPSIGTLHPALKRLMKAGSVTVRSSFSEGGKKSTYYGTTPSAKKHFKELFSLNFSENPSQFFMELQTKLSTMLLLSREDRLMFLDDAILKLESFILDLKNMTEDEYITFDEIQKMLLEKNLSDISGYIELMKSLKEKMQ